MRLYAIAALALLGASIYTLITREPADGAIYTVAGILFWASGVVLIGLGVFFLGRRLGVFGGRTGGDRAKS
jgi:hypothetical protein